MIKREGMEWGKHKVVRVMGNEPFLKAREVMGAKAHYAGLRYDILEVDGGGGDLTAGELSGLLASSSSVFLPQKKLIIIWDANKIKQHKPLQMYCKNPHPDNTLILVGSDKGRAAKWFMGLGVDAEYTGEQIPEWGVAKWLREECRVRGYALSSGLADVMVLNAGYDLYDLTNEIDKILIYKEEGGKTITAEDIQAVLYDHSALSPFEIVRYWGEGQQAVALQFFLRHFEKTPKAEWTKSVLVILGAFLDRVNNLLTARSLKGTGGLGDDKIAQELGISPWVFKNKVAPQLAARNEKKLRDAYQALCGIDVKVKTGSHPPGYLLLQHFIIQY